MFAQMVSELLTPNTFESFRVYTLDTIARLDEARGVLADVERSRMPRAALEPVLAELNWSLHKDPVARKGAAAEIDSLADATKTLNFQLDTLEAHIILLRRIIGASYNTDLEQSLLDNFSNDKRRVLFRQTCGFYCSHLINLGYSKPHITALVHRTFLSAPMQRAGRRSLASFFRHLDGRSRDFIVHTGVTAEFGQHLRQLGYTIRAQTSVSADALDAIRQNSNEAGLQLVLEMRKKALDTYGAMLAVSEELNSLRAITYLDPDGMECDWGDVMHVIRRRSKVGERLQKPRLSFERGGRARASGRRLKSIRNYSQHILSDFDHTSTERILSSINTAALARTSANMENQLISLWSAVEVLLSEPPRDIPRITHYTMSLLPCIALRHIRRQINAVYEEMLVSYRRRFKEILAAEPNNLDKPIAKFAAVLALADNEPLRTQLCTVCTSNPLALHRLWKLHSDYKTLAASHAAISGHRVRLEWQICRIYRARNQLVHAGRVPSYLDSLIMNLAEYYRSAVATIVHRARREAAASDIDQVVAEIGIEYGIYRRHFEAHKKQDPMTREDLIRLIGYQIH